MNIRKLKFLQPHVGASDVILGQNVPNHQHMDANRTYVRVIIYKFNNFAVWFYVLVMILVTSTLLEVRAAIQ